MEYVDKQPYLAQVTDQGFSEDKSGNPFFVLHFKIVGKVANRYQPDEYEPVEVLKEEQTRFTFDASRPDLLDWRIRDLQSLGMEGDDPSVLSPTHPNPVSFVGKKILVSPTIKDNGQKLTTFWNVLTVKARKIEQVSADKVSSKLGNIWKASLERMAKKKEEEKAKEKDKTAKSSEPLPFE